MRSGEEKMLKETQKNWQERRSEKNSFEIFPSFFFFCHELESFLPKNPAHNHPLAATASSWRFSKRWFSHYVNGKMCRISWPCEMEFLVFSLLAMCLQKKPVFR